MCKFEYQISKEVKTPAQVLLSLRDIIYKDKFDSSFIFTMIILYVCVLTYLLKFYYQLQSVSLSKEDFKKELDRLQPFILFSCAMTLQFVGFVVLVKENPEKVRMYFDEIFYVKTYQDREEKLSQEKRNLKMASWIWMGFNLWRILE